MIAAAPRCFHLLLLSDYGFFGCQDTLFYLVPLALLLVGKTARLLLGCFFRKQHAGGAGGFFA